MSNSAIYTWDTPKGALSVHNEDGEHILRLTTRDGNVTYLTDVRVEGDLFEINPEKVAEVCQRYLPVIKQDQTTYQFSVVLYYSAFPDSKQAYEPEDQATKMNFGFEFNKLDTPYLIGFDPKGPSYRRVVRGLNFEGKCQQESCNAKNKMVCIPRGMGTFNVPLEMHQCTCPACDTKLSTSNVKNLGFWDCTYKINGQRDEERVERTDAAPFEKYKTFTPGDDCTWTFLEVTAEPSATPTGGGCAIL